MKKVAKLCKFDRKESISSFKEEVKRTLLLKLDKLDESTDSDIESTCIDLGSNSFRNSAIEEESQFKLASTAKLIKQRDLENESVSKEIKAMLENLLTLPQKTEIDNVRRYKERVFDNKYRLTSL